MVVVDIMDGVEVRCVLRLLAVAQRSIDAAMPPATTLTDTTLSQIDELTQLLLPLSTDATVQAPNKQVLADLTSTTHIITTTLATVTPIPDLHYLLTPTNPTFTPALHIITNLIQAVQASVTGCKYELALQQLELLEYAWAHTELWSGIDTTDALIAHHDAQSEIDHQHTDDDDDDDDVADDQLDGLHDSDNDDIVNENYEYISNPTPARRDSVMSNISNIDHTVTTTVQPVTPEQPEPDVITPVISALHQYYMHHYISNTRAECLAALHRYSDAVHALHACIWSKITLNEQLQLTGELTAAELVNPVTDMLNLCIDIDAITFNNLGRILHRTSHHQIALASFHTAMHMVVICQTVDEHTSVNVELLPYLNNIACILSDMHQYNQAAQYYHAAIDVLDQSHAPVYDTQRTVVQHNLHCIKHVTTHVAPSSILVQLNQIKAKDEAQRARAAKLAAKNKRVNKAEPTANLHTDARYFVQPKVAKGKAKRVSSAKKQPQIIDHNKPVAVELPLRQFVVEPSQHKLLAQLFPAGRKLVKKKQK